MEFFKDQTQNFSRSWIGATKFTLELRRFRVIITQMWRVVCPRRTNIDSLAYLSTFKQGSRDEAKQLKTSSSVLMMSRGCSRGFQIKKVSIIVFSRSFRLLPIHMMICESSTAASLRSNICHLFPFKSWKWCLNFFFLLLFFIYDCKLAWEIAGQNFSYIMV